MSPPLLEHLNTDLEPATTRWSTAATPLASVRLAVDAIVPPPEIRRLRPPNDDQVEALSASLRDHGQLQAIGVRPRADGRYELVFGLRRLTAARRAGLHTISATVFDVDDDQALQLALVENLQRRGLTPAQRVAGLRALAAVYRPGADPADVAAVRAHLSHPRHSRFLSVGWVASLGVSQPTVRRWLGLAHAPELLEAVESGEVPFTIASFVALAPSEARADLLEQINQGELPAAKVRDRVRSLCRAQRQRDGSNSCPARFGDADATSKALKQALLTLEAVVTISTEAEQLLLEQLADRVHALRNAVADN